MSFLIILGGIVIITPSACLQKGLIMSSFTAVKALINRACCTETSSVCLVSMCKLKTQHNKSYRASCTSQLISCPPPISLFPNSPEGWSSCSAAVFNLELGSVISARGMVGLKTTWHCLLSSLVGTHAGPSLLSQRRVTLWGSGGRPQDTSCRNWVATKVFAFGQDLPPHQSQAILGVHVCPPPLPGMAACFCAWQGKGCCRASGGFIKDALHKPVVGLTSTNF